MEESVTSSPTTTIAVIPDTEQVTLINVFPVDPSRQAELVEALDRATSAIFVTVPGFVCTNLHAGLDGTRVVNYAQWAGERQYGEAMRRADVREHLAEASAIAQSWDPTPTRVASIHHPG